MSIEQKKTSNRGSNHYSPEEVRRILLEKIEEERSLNFDGKDSSTDILQDINYDKNKANVLSLFCGAGGLDFGLEIAGIESVLKKDILNTINNEEQYKKLRHLSIFNHMYANDLFDEAIETYKMNFPNCQVIQNKDIRKVKDFPKADLVLGGFPCPGFSEAGPRLIDDPRNFLYLHFIRCLLQSKPKFFIAENVKGMMTLGKGEVFKQIIQDFEAAGYKVYHKLLNSRDFGVPQIRERVFLVGVRHDIDFKYEFPTPSHGEKEGQEPYVTLEDAIKDLESCPGEYFKGSYSSMYMSRNRKKRWDEQSFTIQASGRQAPLHPGGFPMKKIHSNKWEFVDESKERRLSISEIRRIQTFPDWWKFNDGINNKQISDNGRIDKVYKQIGNAVPSYMARAVIKPISDWFVLNINGGRYDS